MNKVMRAGRTRLLESPLLAPGGAHLQELGSREASSLLEDGHLLGVLPARESEGAKIGVVPLFTMDLLEVGPDDAVGQAVHPELQSPAAWAAAGTVQDG